MTWIKQEWCAGIPNSESTIHLWCHIDACLCIHKESCQHDPALQHHAPSSATTEQNLGKVWKCFFSFHFWKQSSEDEFHEKFETCLVCTARVPDLKISIVCGRFSNPHHLSFAQPARSMIFKLSKTLMMSIMRRFGAPSIFATFLTSKKTSSRHPQFACWSAKCWTKLWR